MNVTVSEYSDGELQDRYDSFVNLYKNSKSTLIEIAKKLGISPHLAGRIKKEAIEKGDIDGSSKPYLDYCYFDKNTNKWQICKWNSEKMVFYGTYGSFKEAQMVSNELRKVNWDKNQLPIIQKRIKEKDGDEFENFVELEDNL